MDVFAPLSAKSGGESSMKSTKVLYRKVSTDAFSDGVGKLAIFGHLGDGFLGASLDFWCHDCETFFAILLVHLNQMGHGGNAGSSPSAPVFDDDDFAVLI